MIVTKSKMRIVLSSAEEWRLLLEYHIKYDDVSLPLPVEEFGIKYANQFINGGYVYEVMNEMRFFLSVLKHDIEYIKL